MDSIKSWRFNIDSKVILRQETVKKKKHFTKMPLKKGFFGDTSGAVHFFINHKIKNRIDSSKTLKINYCMNFQDWTLGPLIINFNVHSILISHCTPHSRKPLKSPWCGKTNFFQFLFLKKRKKVMIYVSRLLHVEVLKKNSWSLFRFTIFTRI